MRHEDSWKPPAMPIIRRRRPPPPLPRLRACRRYRSWCRWPLDEPGVATVVAAPTAAAAAGTTLMDTAEEETTVHGLGENSKNEVVVTDKEFVLSKLAAEVANNDADDDGKVSGLTTPDDEKLVDVWREHRTHEPEVSAHGHRQQPKLLENKWRQSAPMSYQYCHHRPKTRQPNQVVTPIGNNETTIITTIMIKRTNRTTTNFKTTTSTTKTTTATTTVATTETNARLTSAVNCDHHRDIYTRLGETNDDDEDEDTPDQGLKWAPVPSVCQRPGVPRQQTRANQGDSRSRLRRQWRRPIPFRSIDGAHDGLSGCCLVSDESSRASGITSEGPTRPASSDALGNCGGEHSRGDENADDEHDDYGQSHTRPTPQPPTIGLAYKQASWRTRRPQQAGWPDAGCAPPREAPGTSLSSCNLFSSPSLLISRQQQPYITTTTSRLCLSSTSYHYNGLPLSRASHKPHSSSNSWCRSSKLLIRRSSPNKSDLTNGPRRFRGIPENYYNSYNNVDKEEVEAEETKKKQETIYSIGLGLRLRLSATKSSRTDDKRYYYYYNLPSLQPLSDLVPSSPLLPSLPSSLLYTHSQCASKHGGNKLTLMNILKLVLVALLIGAQLLGPPAISRRQHWPDSSGQHYSYETASLSSRLVACEPMLFSAQGVKQLVSIRLQTNSTSRFFPLGPTANTNSIHSPEANHQDYLRKARARLVDGPLAGGDTTGTGSTNSMSLNVVANQTTSADCELERDDSSQIANGANDDNQDDYNDYGTYIIYETSPQASSGAEVGATGDTRRPARARSSSGPRSDYDDVDDGDDSDEGDPDEANHDQAEEEVDEEPASALGTMSDQSTSKLSIQRVFFAAKPTRPSRKSNGVDDDDDDQHHKHRREGTTSGNPVSASMSAQSHRLPYESRAFGSRTTPLPASAVTTPLPPLQLPSTTTASSINNADNRHYHQIYRRPKLPVASEPDYMSVQTTSGNDGGGGDESNNRILQTSDCFREKKHDDEHERPPGAHSKPAPVSPSPPASAGPSQHHGHGQPTNNSTNENHTDNTNSNNKNNDNNSRRTVIVDAFGSWRQAAKLSASTTTGLADSTSTTTTNTMSTTTAAGNNSASLPLLLSSSSSSSSSSLSLEHPSNMVRSQLAAGASDNIQNGTSGSIEMSSAAAVAINEADDGNEDDKSASNIITTPPPPALATKGGPRIIDMRHSSNRTSLNNSNGNNKRRDSSSSRGGRAAGVSGAFGRLTGTDPSSSLSKQQPARHPIGEASSSSDGIGTSRSSGSSDDDDKPWPAFIGLDGSTSLTSNSFNIDNDYHHEALNGNKPPSSSSSSPQIAPSWLSPSLSSLSAQPHDGKLNRSGPPDLMVQQWPLDSGSPREPTETLLRRNLGGRPVNNRVVDNDHENHHDRRQQQELDATDNDNHQGRQELSQSNHQHYHKQQQHQSESVVFGGSARRRRLSISSPIHGHEMKAAVGAAANATAANSATLNRQQATTGPPSQSGQPGGVRRGRGLFSGRRLSANDDDDDSTIRASADLSDRHDRATQPERVARSRHDDDSLEPTGDAHDENERRTGEQQHQLDEDDIRWLNKINENAATANKLAVTSSSSSSPLSSSSVVRDQRQSASSSWAAATKPARTAQEAEQRAEEVGREPTGEDDEAWPTAAASKITVHTASSPARRQPDEKKMATADYDPANMDERAVNPGSPLPPPTTQSSLPAATTIPSIYASLLDWFKFKLAGADASNRAQVDVPGADHDGHDHHQASLNDDVETKPPPPPSTPPTWPVQSTERPVNITGDELPGLASVQLESASDFMRAQLEESASRNQDEERRALDDFSANANSTDRQHHHNPKEDMLQSSGPHSTKHNVYYWRLIWFVLPLGATFGNLLVILAVYRERSLQSVTNYFIVSLAFADLFVGLVVMPFAVYVLVNEVWELSDLLCDIFVAVDVTSSTASILNLVAISIDRYLAIAHPIAYSASSSSNRAIFTICLVWLISCCVGAPIILGLNTSPERQSTLCILYNSTFIFWSSLTSFYVPCLIMIGLYYRIFLAIRSRTKKVMIHHQAQGGAKGLTTAAETGQPGALGAKTNTALVSSGTKNLGLKQVNKQQEQIVANIKPFNGQNDRQQQQQQGQLHRRGSLAKRQMQTFEATNRSSPAGESDQMPSAAIVAVANEQDQSLKATTATSNDPERPDCPADGVQVVATGTETALVNETGPEGAPLIGTDEKPFVELKCDGRMTVDGDDQEADEEEDAQARSNSECLVITQLLKQERQHMRDSQQQQQQQHCCHHHHHDHHHTRSRSITENDDCDELDDDGGSHLSDSLCYNSRSNEDESTRSSQSSLESSHYDCSLAQSHNHHHHQQQQHQIQRARQQQANESPRGTHGSSCCQAPVSPVVTSATICSDCQLQIEQSSMVKSGAQKQNSAIGYRANTTNNEQQTQQLQCSLITPTSISWTSTTRKRSSVMSSTYCCESHATSTRCGQSINTSASCECPSADGASVVGRCRQCALVARSQQQQQSPQHGRLAITNHKDLATPSNSLPLQQQQQQQQQPLGMLESARLTIKRRSMKLTQILRGRSRDQEPDSSSRHQQRQAAEAPNTLGDTTTNSRAILFNVRSAAAAAQNGLKDGAAGGGGGSSRSAAVKLLKCARQTPTNSTGPRYSHDLNTATDDGQTRTSSSQSNSLDAAHDDKHKPSSGNNNNSNNNKIIIDQPSSECAPPHLAQPEETTTTAAMRDDNHRLSGAGLPAEMGSLATTSVDHRQSLLPVNMETTTSDKSTTMTATTTTSSSLGERLCSAKRMGTGMALVSARGQRGNNNNNNMETGGPCDQGLLVSKLMSGVANLVSIGTVTGGRPIDIEEMPGRQSSLVANNSQIVTFGDQQAQKRMQQQHHRGNSRRRREKNAARRERKATKTLAIVLGIFLICWTPFFTCNIIDGICIQLNIDCRPGMSVYLVTSWLGYINSCVNPIIYTIFNMEFRRAFKKILTTRPDCSSCCG